MHQPDVDKATYLNTDVSHATCPNANVNADHTIMQYTPNSAYRLHISGACCRQTLKPVYKRMKDQHQSGQCKQMLSSTEYSTL